MALAGICRALGLSASAHYDCLYRRPGARARRDGGRKGRIMTIWIASGGIHCWPRVHTALSAEGSRVRRKRVVRSMGELSIAGVTCWSYKTSNDAGARLVLDLVNRDFSAEVRDRLSVADITQVRTWAGWQYLSAVLDAWS